MRLFIALTIPEEIRQRLTGEQRRLAALELPFRRVDAGAMHLTLVFLGEMAEARVPEVQEAITEAAAGVSPIALSAVGIGTFPPRGMPRVVWAGVDGDRGALQKLYEALGRALAARGFGGEERHFLPHVTLGRVGSRVTSDARERLRATERYCVPDDDFGGWTAREVHLIRSELRAEGARYTTLYTSTLNVKS